MPVTRFEAEELDRETLDYLHRVVANRGQGLPGLYFDAEDAQLKAATLPIWGIIAGPVVIGLTLLLTWGSVRDPTPVALLMTAGLFLGGWLVLAWLRCLVARRSARHVGHFKYLDPLFLWYGTGGGVEVEPLALLTDAEAVGSRVRIRKADGDVFLDLRGRRLAEEAEEYLTTVRDQAAADPAERGYAALARIRDEEDLEADRVEGIPTPRRARPARRWLAPVLIVAALVALFFCCKALATALRDDALFDYVQNKDAAHLRIYLIDARNTRHRDEVVGRLKRVHDQVANGLEARQGDRPLLEGLAGIVRSLHGDAQPLVTVSFATAPAGPDVPEGYLSEGVLTTLNRRVLLDMRQALKPLVSVAPTPIPGAVPVPNEPIELVDLAQAVEGPAMLSVAAKVKPADKESRDCRISWTVTLQPDLEAEKHVTTFETRLPQPGDDPAPAVRALYGNFGEAFRARLSP